MTIDDLNEWLEAAPFVPFTIHLAGGAFVPVHHPDFVSPKRSNQLLEIHLPADSLAWVSLLHITHLISTPRQPGVTSAE